MQPPVPAYRVCQSGAIRGISMIRYLSYLTPYLTAHVLIKSSVILQTAPVRPELSHHTVPHISRQTVGAKCLVPCTMRNDAAVTRTWTGQTACNVVPST